uniref:Peptidase_S9 domain-containing protein n=1 Tax=Panagrellus redivivus TaxID=6233 RepID=A0A7E4V716_PANRE
MKYKDICELRATSYGPVFTLSDSQTGATCLYDMKQRKNQSVPYRRCEVPLRSNLNEYGAATFNVIPITEDLVCINKSKVFVVPNDDDKPYKYIIDKKGFRFGDPHVVGDWLYMVADMPDNGQAIIRYNLPQVMQLSDPTKAEHEIVAHKRGHFYGGLTSGPNGKYIAYNTWMAGMAFDSADVVLQNVATNAIRVMIGVNNGALLWPNFDSESNLWFYSEGIKGSHFERYDMAKDKAEKKKVGKRKHIDIGDPYWIMGNQRFFILTGKFIIYTIEDKLIVRDITISKTLTLDIDNVDLLSVDPSNKNKVYFKSDDQLYKRVYSIDLSVDNLAPTVVYTIPYYEEPLNLFLPEVIKYEGINGYLYQHCAFDGGYHDRTMPTIIWLHGGPAMRVHKTIDFRKQAYLEAGFNLVDLVYTGSGGLGRNYRVSLYNYWGVRDVEDVLDAVNKLLEMEVAEEGSIFLVGSSAGAYLALGALADDTKNLICAAAVSASFTDPTALLNECPVFEREYTEDLLPAVVPDVAGKLIKKKAHVAFFHGEFDPVVSSTDARAVSKRLTDAGGRTVFHELKDEGHSFKKADSICFVVQKTLDFFQHELANLPNNQPNANP